MFTIYMEDAAEKEKARKYILLAKFKADLFSKDPHTKVGCIILSHDFSRILSTGTNGLPRHMDDHKKERWERPAKYSYISHAESNSIANAARSGTPLEGGVIAVTKFPCTTCTKLMIQAGIKKVYTIAPNFDSDVWGADARISEEMLNEVGIDLIKFDDKIFECT